MYDGDVQYRGHTFEEIALPIAEVFWIFLKKCFTGFLEGETLIICLPYVHYWGSNPQPVYVPSLGIEKGTFCCME